jgi:hypothetical protein
MQIYIPTRQRPNNQITLKNLDEVNIAAPILVINESDRKDYAAHLNKLVLPDSDNNIGKVRQRIIEHAVEQGHDKICMLDDDLHFYKRKPPTGNTSLSFSLLDATIDEKLEMFALIEQWLDEVVHCAVSAREGNNHVEQPHIENSRPLRFLAYRPQALVDNNVRFDRLTIQEDFDVCLQLLRLGLPNRISYLYGQGQKGSGLPGGCAGYRDHALMEQNAHALAALHPGFVKVHQKTTKGSFGGGTRTDVICYWGKAFKSAQPAIVGFE